MADLVSGRFPQSYSPNLWFGTNVVNGSYPARSNAEYLGLSNTSDGAIAGTGVFVAVPIPIDPLEVVTNVSIVTGATACSLPTHAFAALYSSAATPALLGQSTDSTSVTAFAASTVYKIALTNPYQVKAADCTGGYIWAGFSITSTTQPTAVSLTTPTACQAAMAWITGGPAALSATSGSSLGGTAAATLTIATKAVAPLVWLT